MRAISWSHPGVPRAVIGAALYLTVVAVLTLGPRRDHPQHCGRNRRLRGDLLRPPAADERAPDELEQRDLPYLPRNAGRAIISLTHDQQSLAPWTGFGLFCAYAAATLAVAAILLVRRDT